MKSIVNLVRTNPLKAGRKRGVTLIEAVLFISIALGLIVGGIVFFQQASLAQRVQGAVRTISSIASETRALFQAQQDFTGANTATLIASGAVPTSIINGANLRNEWGGTITVDPTNNVGVTGAGAAFATNFTVTYTAVPQAACVRLSSYDNSGAGVVGSSIVQVAWKTNGSADVAAANLGGATQAAGNGVLPAEATAACTAAGALTDIAYTFGR